MIISMEPAMATMERLIFSEKIRIKLPKKMIVERMAATFIKSFHLHPARKDRSADIHTRSNASKSPIFGDNQDVMQIVL